MGILKEEEWKWADEDNKADDVDVTLHLYHRDKCRVTSTSSALLSSSAHFHSSSFKIPIFFNLQLGILKEEEWKWADEDNKADDVDVTLHLYHRGTWYKNG
jgi:hypothetical protein